MFISLPFSRGFTCVFALALSLSVFAPIEAALGSINCIDKVCAQGTPESAATDSLSAQALNAIVKILVTKQTYEGGHRALSQSQGSGTLIGVVGFDDRIFGLILTNDHVADWETVSLRVYLPNASWLPAVYMSGDVWTDLAVIAVDMVEARRLCPEFVPVSFGDSSVLKVDDDVWAMGSPVGLRNTLTRGQVSFTRRVDNILWHEGDQSGIFTELIQFSAPIAPGSSGGGLFNSQGELVGVTAQGMKGMEGFGFAIPGNLAQEVLCGLLDEGAVVRSEWGFEIRPWRMLGAWGQAHTQGVFVIEITPGQPASIAGLKVGDIILCLQGPDDDEPHSLFAAEQDEVPGIYRRFSSYPPGSVLNLEIEREGKGLSLVLITDKMQRRTGKKAAFPDWELVLMSLTPALCGEHALSQGVMVYSLDDKGKAAEAGLQEGELILKAGFSFQELVPVATLEDFSALYSTAIGEKKRLLVLARKMTSKEIAYHLIGRGEPH